jgi:inorganic pyrophosphatase
MLKVCVQVTAGSGDINLYDEKTLDFKRTLRVSQPYPYAYGFILETRAADGDNLDCYIITRQILKPGTILECNPIGLLEQHEGDEIDHKVLATLAGQPVPANQSLLQELQDFIYAMFAEFPGEEVRVGPILSKEAALRHIEACRQAWR